VIEGSEMSKSEHRFHFLSRMLFLDIFFDRRTRPILIYAAVIIILGAALYHWLEGWGWLDSIYFVVITLTTIGYGDFHPTTSVTKIITIFYGLNGIMLILMMFDIVRTVRGWGISNPPANSENQLNR
jgi:hypothetical protein